MIEQQINLSEKTITKLINNINPEDTTLLESIIGSSNQTNGIKLKEEQLDLLFDKYKLLLTSDLYNKIKDTYDKRKNKTLLDKFDIFLTKQLLTTEQTLDILTDQVNSTHNFDMTPYQNKQELLLKSLQFNFNMLFEQDQDKFFNFIHTVGIQNFDKIKKFILSISPELEDRLDSLYEKIQSNNNVTPKNVTPKLTNVLVKIGTMREMCKDNLERVMARVK
jgi:hypothetical protein